MAEEIQGKLVANKARYVVLASRFNELVVERLVSGAERCLVRHGISHDQIRVVWCPGAYEMPVVARELLEQDRCDAIIAVGAVIRGGTAHFDFVAQGCLNGLAGLSVDYGAPIGMGVLTCDTLEQCLERAGSKAGNKGEEAALAVLETVNLCERIAKGDLYGQS